MKPYKRVKSHRVRFTIVLSSHSNTVKGVLLATLLISKFWFASVVFFSVCFLLPAYRVQMPSSPPLLGNLVVRAMPLFKEPWQKFNFIWSWALPEKTWSSQPGTLPKLKVWEPTAISTSWQSRQQWGFPYLFVVLDTVWVVLLRCQCVAMPWQAYTPVGFLALSAVIERNNLPHHFILKNQQKKRKILWMRES